MPEARTFAVGETVRLRSGSPLMTVTQTAPDAISCSWFERSEHGFGGELQEGSFAPPALEASSDKTAAPPAATPPVGGIRGRLAR